MALTRCCFCIGVKEGSKVIGILCTIISIGFVIRCIVGGINTEPTDQKDVTSRNAYIGWGITGLGDIVVNVLMTIGCYKNKRSFVLAWLVLAMLGIAGSLILTLFSLLLGLLEISKEAKLNGNKDTIEAEKIILVGVSVLIIVITGIKIYFWCVVQSFYSQMNEGVAYQPMSKIEKA